MMTSAVSQSPPSSCVFTQIPLSYTSNIRLTLLRDDLLHPVVSGNKWRKLKPLLQHSSSKSLKGLMSVGGIHSNHIDALAYVGHLLQIPVYVWVRGLKEGSHRPADLTATLKRAESLGTQLIPCSRRTYDAQKHLPFLGLDDSKLEEVTSLSLVKNQQTLIDDDDDTHHDYAHHSQLDQSLGTSWRGWLWIPEGGSSIAAQQSCARLPFDVRHTLHQQKIAPATHFVVSVGSGCTAAGILDGLRGDEELCVYSPFKPKRESAYGEIDEIEALIQAQITLAYPNTSALTSTSVWERLRVKLKINHDAHFGGFGYPSREVTHFINHFGERFGVPLDPIYTGKALYGLIKDLKRGLYPLKSHVIFIHTGGLQGVEGMNHRTRPHGYEISPILDS